MWTPPFSKRAFLRLSCTVALLAILSPARAAEPDPGPARSAKRGEIYYTQFSLFHEDYRHETTNYRKRTLVPINTPVEFVELRISNPNGSPLVSPEIVVKLPEGKKLYICNVKKYSGENLDGIFSRTLGKEKVDLSSFTQLEKDNILLGHVAIGMSKAAVIRAMGYPPKHQTPDLKGDKWTYWHNRMGSFPVRFREDKVFFVE